jgi:hypothetical protein
MEINKLPIEAAAILGSTHEVVIDYTDLSDTAGTGKTLTVTIPAGSWVRGGAHVLETDFTDGAATMSSLVYTVGDDADADLYMTSTQVETTGTPIVYKAPTPGSGAVARETGKVYAGADTLDIAFTATGANLSTLTGGKLRYYFALVGLDDLKKG